MAPNTSRFGSLSPTFSPTSPLRRLKTVFSNGSSHQSHEHDSHSAASTSTTSPLSRSASTSACSDDGHSDFSPMSFTTYSGSSSRTSSPSGQGKRFVGLRSKPSVLDLELLEERRSFGHELNMLEPRPATAQVGLGFTPGIFEVLDGRA